MFGSIYKCTKKSKAKVKDNFSDEDDTYILTLTVIAMYKHCLILSNVFILWVVYTTLTHTCLRKPKKLAFIGLVIVN